jgi:hypothetical protein
MMPDAAVELADQVLGRHPDVVEPDLVDLVAAVDQLDRPDLQALALHVDEQHRDAGLLLGLGVGADQGEDPVAVLPERGPGLLAVDDPVVAVPDRSRAQAGQVGAGVGLGEALAPEDVDVGGLREELLLLLLGPELRDDRPDHPSVEGERRRHEGPLHLLVPDVELDLGPVLAAPLDRPARHGEPGGVERPHALDELVLGQLTTLGDGAPDPLVDLGREELAHLVTERALLLGQLELHAPGPSSYADIYSPVDIMARRVPQHDPGGRRS